MLKDNFSSQEDEQCTLETKEFEAAKNRACARTLTTQLRWTKLAHCLLQQHLQLSHAIPIAHERLRQTPRSVTEAVAQRDEASGDRFRVPMIAAHALQNNGSFAVVLERVAVGVRELLLFARNTLELALLLQCEPLLNVVCVNCASSESRQQSRIHEQTGARCTGSSPAAFMAISRSPRMSLMVAIVLATLYMRSGLFISCRAERHSPRYVSSILRSFRQTNHSLCKSSSDFSRSSLAFHARPVHVQSLLETDLVCEVTCAAWLLIDEELIQAADDARSVQHADTGPRRNLQDSS